MGATRAPFYLTVIIMTVKSPQEAQEAVIGPSLPLPMDFVNGRGKEWMPLSEDTWEQDLEKVPLFMKGIPNMKDIEDSPELQALQSMIFEGTTEGK
jgi:hypothetical protein